MIAPKYCSLAFLSVLIACCIAARIDTSKTSYKHTERILGGFLQCNSASKAAFATAFKVAAAVRAPYPRCKSMTWSEWKLVGCGFAHQLRYTKICAPAKWGRVLRRVIKADAMALKTKILFRHGISRKWLFNTSRGRALVRHELQHIRQQSSLSAYKYGWRYIGAYCRVGRKYWKNPYEVDARKFQYDSCVL